ncbi:MAG: membrane protein [Acidimicrobiia bacterium]|nr:MAG: membrane protein [Acidimicrobiia bacterium]GIU91069.1 MAG: membrane protein [Acidimicrobiia bacterium]
MLAAEWTVLQVFWSVLWVTIFVLWIFLVIRVFVDIFRSRDLSGWAKALWTIFVILFPYLGVFVYLVARGHKMAEHELAAAQANEAAVRAYIREAAGTTGGSGAADELERLASLRDRGVIDDAEFARLKAQIVG